MCCRNGQPADYPAPPQHPGQNRKEAAQDVRVRLMLRLPGPVAARLRQPGAGVRQPGPRHPGERVRGLQCLHLRLRPNRLGQVVHHDGRP